MKLDGLVKNQHAPWSATKHENMLFLILLSISFYFCTTHHARSGHNEK